ncbi:MAG: RsmD family RNA methyltransferase [Synergistaceae bacterium]|jgi:16S rRNA (guanine(966)-N(2))-methyltransferase RsmD|nr:RsmD family RNA methyltransferase [Synergistaceae bacterium]
MKLSRERENAERSGRAKKEARPTTGMVSGALFNILTAAGLIAGARFLDLFSGTGKVAAAAMKHGAAFVLAVESERDRAERISSLLSDFGDAALCVRADVRRTLPKLERDEAVFDVIFADPPYGLGWGEVLPSMIAERASILSPGGAFVMERAARDAVLDPPGGIFLPRDDRLYGGTALSIYRKNQ